MKSCAGQVLTGGVLLDLDQIPARKTDDSTTQIAISFAQMSISEVDSLLFQLSLIREPRPSLLFMPSGRESLDMLVRNRAAGYGVTGKRPRSGVNSLPWLRGSDLLVGRPSPGECAAAALFGVPQVILCPRDQLGTGEGYLAKHGLAQHVEAAIALAVEIEALLPGAPRREAMMRALKEFAPGDVRDVVAALRRAATGSKVSPPRPEEVRHSDDDDELETIGEEVRTTQNAGPLPDKLRKAYLSELILQQKHLARQVERARAGIDTWQHRAHLARNADDDDLAAQAQLKVDGLERILQSLEHRHTEITQLRSEFSRSNTVSPGARRAAVGLLGNEAAATIETMEKAQEDAWGRLEVDELLKQLKRKLEE